MPGIRLFGALLCAAATLMAPAPNARAAEIVVTHYGSLLYGLPYAIAQEKGWFKEEGVDITGILSSKGGGTSVRNLLAGDTLYAEVALPAALAALKEGYKLKIINAGTDGSSGFWVTRPGEKAETIADIKGKRFAYSRPKSVTESLVIAMLKSHGLTTKDAQLVAAGDIGAGVTALVHNKVDFATIPEPLYSLKTREGGQFQAVVWLDAKVPEFTQTVGIASVENIAKRGNELAALIKARRRGVDLIYSNQAEAAAILAKAYNLPADVSVSAIANLRKVSDRWWNPGQLNYPAMNNMADALATVGALELPIDWDNAVDARFVPQDLKATR